MARNKRQVKSKNDLPKWFNIERYNFVDDLSDHEVIQELWARWFLHAHRTKAGRADFGQEISRIQALWKEICLSARVSDSAIFCSNKETISNFELEKSLNTVFERASAVQPLRLIDFNLSRELSKNNVITDEIESSTKNEGDLTWSSSHAAVNNGYEGLNSHISVNLNLLFDDKVIIEQLTALLPAWRQRKIDLGLFSSEPIKRSQVDIDKIRRYRLIPFIDLRIWASINSLRIGSRTLEIALFPHGCEDLGLRFITTTLEPFYKKIMNPHYLRLLEERSPSTDSFQ